MATWPAGLPQSPLLRGYQRTMPDLIVQTEMDAGTPKARQRFTAASEPVTWNTLLTDVQKDTLETFYKTTVAGGALSFDITLPDVTGTSSVRIIEQPSFVALKDDLWSVSLKMIKLP